MSARTTARRPGHRADADVGRDGDVNVSGNDALCRGCSPPPVRPGHRCGLVVAPTCSRRSISLTLIEQAAGSDVDDAPAVRAELMAWPVLEWSAQAAVAFTLCHMG